MGEAEEVERGAMRSRVLGALRPLEAEVDEARLVGMEREPIPGKTLAQYSQDPRGIGKGLESHHEIVGVPDKAGSPLQAWSDRAFEPLIQHLVQVDVRNTRGDHSPLGDPWVGRCRRPSSRTPAFSHLSIIRRMTPSVTRWSRKSRRWPRSIVSNDDAG